MKRLSVVLSGLMLMSAAATADTRYNVAVAVTGPGYYVGVNSRQGSFHGRERVIRDNRYVNHGGGRVIHNRWDNRQVWNDRMYRRQVVHHHYVNHPVVWESSVRYSPPLQLSSETAPPRFTWITPGSGENPANLQCGPNVSRVCSGNVCAYCN